MDVKDKRRAKLREVDSDQVVDTLHNFKFDN